MYYLSTVMHRWSLDILPFTLGVYQLSLVIYYQRYIIDIISLTGGNVPFIDSSVSFIMERPYKI